MYAKHQNSTIIQIYILSTNYYIITKPKRSCIVQCCLCRGGTTWYIHETTLHNWSTQSYLPLPASCNYNILGWDGKYSIRSSVLVVRHLYKLSYTLTTPSLEIPVLVTTSQWSAPLCTTWIYFPVSIVNAVQIFQRGSKYFEIFGLGGPCILGVQIFRDRPIGLENMTAW